MTEPVVPELLTPYITVSSSFDNDDFKNVDFKDARVRHVKRLLEQEPNLIVLPAISGEDDTTSYQGLLSDNQYIIMTGSADGRTRTCLISNKEVLGSYGTMDSVPQSDAINPENSFPLVQSLPFGNIGFLHEKEMLLPEAARCLMLSGADAVIWQHGMSFEKAAPLARTRAAENRIFIIAVYSDVLGNSSSAASFIVDPSGGIIASTLLGKSLHATGTYCNFCNARLKAVVPGTHIVLDRIPGHYEKLTQNN